MSVKRSRAELGGGGVGLGLSFFGRAWRSAGSVELVPDGDCGARGRVGGASGHVSKMLGAGDGVGWYRGWGGAGGTASVARGTPCSAGLRRGCRSEGWPAADAERVGASGSREDVRRGWARTGDGVGRSGGRGRGRAASPPLPPSNLFVHCQGRPSRLRASARTGSSLERIGISTAAIQRERTVPPDNQLFQFTQIHTMSQRAIDVTPPFFSLQFHFLNFQHEPHCAERAHRIRQQAAPPSLFCTRAGTSFTSPTALMESALMN